MFFALFFIITLSSPALAGPPEGDAEAPAADAKADEKADDKADDAKADDAEAADDKADDAKADDAKADDAKATGGDDAKADDAKADTKELGSEEEAVSAAEGLYSAITNRNWALALSFGLALLVWFLRKVKVLSKVPAKAVPWTAAVMAAAGYVVVSLATPGVAIGTALAEGAAAGAAAVGLWEMLLKHFLGGKKDS